MTLPLLLTDSASTMNHWWNMASRDTNQDDEHESDGEGGAQHQQELDRELRSFSADQMEIFGFFIFSLFQAAVAAGQGVLAGWLLPLVHSYAGQQLPKELLTKWDNTHHNLGRYLEQTFVICGLALLIIGGIVMIVTALRTLIAYYRKELNPPTSSVVKGKLRIFALHCLVSALAFSALFLVSMAINALTAYPLAWLLPKTDGLAVVAGWILTAVELTLLVIGLLFAFLQHIRSAGRLLQRKSSEPGSKVQPSL